MLSTFWVLFAVVPLLLYPLRAATPASWANDTHSCGATTRQGGDRSPRLSTIRRPTITSQLRTEMTVLTSRSVIPPAKSSLWRSRGGG